MVLLPAVSWPWVPAWGSLEPPRRDGENAQKRGKTGKKWARYSVGKDLQAAVFTGRGCLVRPDGLPCVGNRRWRRRAALRRHALVARPAVHNIGMAARRAHVACLRWVALVPAWRRAVARRLAALRAGRPAGARLGRCRLGVARDAWGRRRRRGWGGGCGGNAVVAEGIERAVLVADLCRPAASFWLFESRKVSSLPALT